MPTPLEKLSAALSDRYRIDRELGRGGMATVYLAEDLKHRRRVAIKVFAPELAAVVGSERFLREIEVTANLQHPHIMPLYDSGAEGGEMYYVMPFLEGESLRDRLDREGPLPVDEAIAITRTIAAALEYAHRHGVVHRDIKPANIMLQAGNPIVTDFGIAIAVDSASADRITMTGLSIGTPVYMSPEQATGERVVRPASDVYSLACVLFEMLAGEPPFSAPNAAALVARVVTERPRKLRTLRESVPVHVEAAVDRALAKLPADRYSSAAAFADALAATPSVAAELAAPANAPTPVARSSRGPMLAVASAAVVIALAAGVYFVRRGGSSIASSTLPSTSASASDAALYVQPVDDKRPSIAVLSFADMSPKGDQQYFSDGISEEILSVLSRIRDLRVAARATAFTYKGRDLDLRRVGRELGVRYLLGGSVRKDGDQLRITAELVSVADGFRSWSQTYDRRLQNVFAIQSDIAQRIAGELRVPLGIAPEELALPTSDMAAHDLYLNARAAMRRRGEGIAEAIRLLERAVARDSMWAPAWSGLAEAWALRPLYEGKAGESTDSAVWANSLMKADRAARRALALDPRNAGALVALGTAHFDRWEWEESERALRSALALDPDNHEAHTQYAELLWAVGRLDESAREATRAVELDRAPVRFDALGFALYTNGRYAEAEARLEEGIAIDSSGDVHFLRTVLGRQMLFRGRYREALRRFAFYIGDTASFRLQGEALEHHDPKRLERAKQVYAQTWLLLGERERALDELERQVFAMPYRVPFHLWDQILAPLQNERRFQEVILPRVHLQGRVPHYLPAEGTAS